jgi:hypothetical protein
MKQKKNKIEPFADLPSDDGGNRYVVNVIIGQDDAHPGGLLYEDFDIVRELTEEEQKRLQQATSLDEINDLLDLVININEPTEYSVDLRGK